MKIYIAGKISGDPNYEAKFKAEADNLEEQGHIVLNPATLPPGLTPEDYMKICFAMIDAAELVVFLPDWINSGGAMLEHTYCGYTGKRIEHIREDTAMFDRELKGKN